MGGGPWPMVGRDVELQALCGDLAAAAAGAGRCTVIEGEPGIGKSRLVEEALARSGGELRVLTAATVELEHERPFAPLLRVFPVPITTPVAAEAVAGGFDRTWRMVDALVDAVEQAAAEAPLALVVEDVHWADTPTVMTLGELARRVTALPVALVLTRRAAPSTPDLDAVVRLVVDGCGRRVRLGPLGVGDVAALAGEALGIDLDDDVLTYLARAAGNPFLLTELVEAVARQADGVGQRGPGDLTVPPDVHDAVLTRMAPLGSEPRWLARTASVLGARISVAELAAVAGTTSAALLPALEELIGVGVLEEQGNELAFRHDLTRSALYESLPAAVRAGVHRDIARVLIERGAAAVEVAHHLVEGAERGDATSVAWLQRAAEEASVQAPGVGADLLERAAALVDTRSPEGHAIAADRARLLAWSGQLAQAEALARELLATGSPDAGAQSRLLATLGESLFFQGRVGEAGSSLQAAAERAAPERSLRVAEAALAVALNGQMDEAEVLAVRAEAEGADDGDLAAVALGLAVRSQLVGLRGNHAEAAVLARRSLEVADGDPARSHRYGPSLFLGSTLMEMDADDAERVLRRGLALDAAQGTGWGAPVYHFFLGAHHLNRGTYESAVAVLEAGLGLAADTGLRVMTPFAHGLLAHIAVRRDDLDAAARHLAAGEALIGELGPHFGLEVLLWSRALLLEARGDLDAGLNVLSAAWAAARGIDALIVCRFYGVDLARMALAAGQPAVAAEAAAGVEAAAARAGTATYRGSARRCRGLVDGDPGALLEAVDIMRDSPRMVERAGTMEDAGAALLPADREAGADLLEEALAGYEGAGAARDASRVRAALRSVGRRRQRPAASSSPGPGWSDLSPTERRVVALVAEGHSNREVADRLFLSRRTVDNHLYRVFTKLEVANRVELSLRVRSWGPFSP